MDGCEGISEGGKEKSTDNRCGLLSSKQGLIEIAEGGDTGPIGAWPTLKSTKAHHDEC